MTTDYWVQPGIGNDANAGTSRGAGNSWATLQKAADTAVAGDNVFLEGTETVSTMIDFDTNAGVPGGAGYINFIGLNTSGVEDGTRYTLNANANTLTDIAKFDVNFLRLKNIRFTNCDGNAIGEGVANKTGLVFENCSFDNCTGIGVSLPIRYSLCSFIRCCVYNITGSWGMYVAAARILFCAVHDNTGSGIYGRNNYNIVLDSLVYDNGNDGYTDLYNGSLIGHCAINGNEDDGVVKRAVATTTFPMIFATRVTNHDDVGDIGVNASNEGLIYGWNYYENNAGNNIQNNPNGWEILFDGAGTDVEDQGDTNQGYTSLVDGSEDFNLRDDASQRRTGVVVPLV